MLHTKATGKASIVVGSPSLGTTPRNIGLVRWSIASSLAICRMSISVVVDDVAALVYFQNGPVPDVAAKQSVPLVLPHLTSRGEQVHIAPDEEIVVEIRLERFGGYLSPVHVHCEEVNVVVLGVKRILHVRTVVRIIIDAAQHQTFRQDAEEQVLVRVRSSARENGVHLAVE